MGATTSMTTAATAAQQPRSVAGELNSAQHYYWMGRWPDGAAGRAELLNLMERQHFRSVSRFSLWAVRCHRRGNRVDCSLPGGALAMAFVDAVARVEERRVERCWRIVPGLLARRSGAGETEHGWLRVGMERLPEGRNHAWVSVSAFPSRFLSPLPRGLAAAAPVWRLVGRLYTAFHAQAGYSCLRALAASVEREPGR
jgi:hypothetical protein